MGQKLGEAIKNALKRVNMTQADLARVMSVRESTVCNWINGSIHPTASKLLVIMSVLNLVPDLFPEYQKIDVDPEPKTTEYFPNYDKPHRTGETRRLLAQQIKRIEELEAELKKTKYTQKPQIMIIEDDYTAYFTIHEALKKAEVNCFCIHASNIEMALKMLKESKEETSLIILDLILTNLPGLDFLSTLADEDNYCDTPIIITSADDDVIQKALQYNGIFGVVKKPFTLNQFIKILCKINLDWPLVPAISHCSTNSP